MLTNLSRARVIGTWVTVVVLAMVVSVIAGAEMTGSAVALWVIAGVAPAVVTLLLWHGPPEATVADVLYPATNQKKSGR